MMAGMIRYRVAGLYQLKPGRGLQALTSRLPHKFRRFLHGAGGNIAT